MPVAEKHPTQGTLPAEDFDPEAVRADFPALQQTIYEDKPLVYLDNAATSQKPQAVIDRLTRYYSRENSNVHRGVHRLSQEATDAFEGARSRIARYINAPAEHQVIFVRGCTEGINLVASTFGRQRIGEGDEIVITTLEHHSNIVPWQMLCEARGASLRVVPINDHGEVIYEAYEDLLNDRTKLVAITHVSNTLGTINPVREMIEDAHARDIPVLVDGAQAIPHMPVDVQELNADFYAFSGHKAFGPTGIGVLYGRESLLEDMPPYQGGGDMIDEVAFEKTTYAELPNKLEAGTPHIAGAIGLGAALDYLSELNPGAVLQYENDLLRYATERLEALDGLEIIGTARRKASVISFNLEGVHPYDAGTVLDRLGIAVRTGHHCTQPLVEHLDLPGTVRASFAFYNTRDEVDRLVDGVRRVQSMFG